MPDAELFVVTPPMIPGYGMGNGFELYLQDKSAGDINVFKEISNEFVAALNERPEIEMAYSAFDTSYPQYWVDIDAAQCERAGISTAEVLETLSGYYGGGYVSNFNRFSKLYRVIIQADPSTRVTSESLNHFYVRVGDEMAPLSQFVRLTKTYGPQSLNRFNLYNSIAVSGTPAQGYSSGDALNAVKETAEKVLPKGYGYEYGGISREESKTGSNVVIIFAVCIVLVYLILSGMYESLILPLVVILSVPCGLMGSFLFAQLFGLENNIYLQTARWRVEQAEALMTGARMAYLPTLSLAADGTLNRWDGTTSKSYNVGAVAGWEVDVFGKQTVAKRQAHADLEISRAYAQAVQTTLVASVASTYYTLLMLDEQISIGEQTLQSWAETISTLQALKCAGRANDVGILQSGPGRTGNRRTGFPAEVVGGG